MNLAGGFVVGVARSLTSLSLSPTQMGLLNMLSAVAGFTIVGCLVTNNRWLHLVLVAVGLWLAGLVGLMVDFSLVQWLASAISTFIAMGIGGALASLLKKKNA